MRSFIIKTRACAAAIMLLLILSFTMYVSAAEMETVRVGFFYQDGYHEVDESGRKDGYGYTLMQHIRRYADIDFEYIGYENSWAEMFEMLEQGEIDVLTNVYPTPERQERFLFSDIPVGTCDVILAVKTDHCDIVQGSYDTYSGKNIGFVSGVAENRVFASFAKEHDFWYRAVYFDDTTQLSEALHTGQVDAIVSTDFRVGHDEWILERMTASDVYLIVRQDDAELMAKLNDALKCLDSNEAGWRGVLKNTYYPYSSTSGVYFNMREQKILERFSVGGEVLKVTAMPDHAPYSWFEQDENGRTVARGVYNEYFQYLAESMGIQYKYVIPRSVSEYDTLVKSGLVDLVIDMPSGYFEAEKNGYVQTPEYDCVSMARVYTRKFGGETTTVAYLKTDPFMLERIRELHPNAEIVVYESIETAVTAVEEGWVDFLYCLDHTAKTIVNQDDKAQLRYALVETDAYGFAIAARDDVDRAVVSAFSKEIKHSGGDILWNLYNHHINFGVSQLPGFRAAIYNDPIPAIILGSVVILTICFCATGFVLARRREREVVLRKEIESGAILRTMYTAMPFGLLRLEITGEEYKITYANRHFLDMLGVSDLKDASGLYEQGLCRELLDRDRYDVRTLYERMELIGDAATAESRIKMPDGKIRWFRCNSTLVDIVGKTRVVQQLILDITEERAEHEREERKHTDEAIQRMFGTLTKTGSDIYVLYSLDKSKVRFVSPNTEQQLGIPVEEAYRDPKVFLRIELEGKIVRPLEKLDAIQKGDSLLGEVKRIHQHTGEMRWYRDEAYATSINGELHLIVVMSDITQERSRREALQMALENAENASKAKTTFLSNMSHDIRTPMNAIVGLTNLLKSDAEDNKRAARHLDHLEIAANNMMEIINNILDMSRIENGSTILNEAPFSLVDLLRDVEAISATQARIKGLSVCSSVKISGGQYIGDALRLKQILLNLVSNAVKYTDEGGRIDITLCEHGRMGSDHHMIRFEIRDTGIGMSEAFLEKLFTPFEREHNSTTGGVVGTGLGMTIVKNMVDLMGGVIQVSSTVGEGSTFTVDIPLRLAEEAEDPRFDASTEREELDISGVRLLVAEDNELNAEILIELLQREGAVCHWAENGKIAVDKFLSAPENTYDVILMDVQMPVMGGYDAVRAIRESGHPQASSIPVSAMTANAFTEDIENALAAGMNAHVAKPVDMASLKETICRLLKDR